MISFLGLPWASRRSGRRWSAGGRAAAPARSGTAQRWPGGHHPVEAVPDGLAGRSPGSVRNHPASQGRPGWGAAGVVPGGDQQGAGVVVADAQERYQLGGGGGEPVQLGGQGLALEAEAWWRRARVPSASMAAAGGLVIGPGTRAAAAATRVAAGRSRSCSRSSAGAVTTGALRALLAWGGPGSRSVGRPAAPGSSPPARFRPWATVAWPAWTARAAGLGLGRVGLAAAAAGLAVGSVDLHHDLAACGQEAGQGGAGGAGAFHAPAMAGRARGPSRAGPDSRWGWWGRCGCRRGGRAGRRRGRGGCPGGCRPRR
jgi:hypothetical protein